MATINKDALVDKLQLTDAFSSHTKKFTREFIDDFFKAIADEVVAGNTVSITGFGKLELFTRQNGTVKPKFTAFKEFKDAAAATAAV